MCTLTIVPMNRAGDDSRPAIRVVCNRDESRLRPIATPPAIERFGARQAVLPRDPQAGGTWIGANDAGHVLVLLNASAPDDEPTGEITSRGEIIPSLLAASSLKEAVDSALRMDVAQFRPFRLVIIDRFVAVELARERNKMVLRGRLSTSAPLMFTSSGLGDELVASPRRELFREHFAAGADWRAQQDAFHRHQWPGREHVSVLMCRPDARTVSRTEIELGDRWLQVAYADLAKGNGANSSLRTLPLLDDRAGERS